MLTLPELFVQLPPSVAAHLETLLEDAHIPEHPTRTEVFHVANDIAAELRQSENDTQVLSLLDQIAPAIVEQLFA